jgi:ParB family chromosome partitioning protein
VPRKGKPSGTPRRRKGVKLKPTELGPGDLSLTDPPEAVRELMAAVAKDGGAVLASYREPLGGHALLLAALPIEKVAPTPFQRDISDAHVRRLTQAMDKTKRFLDPVIAVRDERAVALSEAVYWVPNGYHRLTALKELGAKTLLALLVPETDVAYQILALNIEKAHNLREKALGVVRMYRDLLAAGLGDGGEEERALEFEEPALATLGFAYEKRGRLSGGAYHALLRKADTWIGGTLGKSLAGREARAEALLTLDEAVTEVIAKLKEKGFMSPYLRPFVVGRINPLRFIKGKVPPVDELLEGMTKRAKGMDVAKIKPADVARTGGPPPEGGD